MESQTIVFFHFFIKNLKLYYHVSPRLECNILPFYSFLGYFIIFNCNECVMTLFNP